jgi:hypothetical protein
VVAAAAKAAATVITSRFASPRPLASSLVSFVKLLPKCRAAPGVHPAKARPICPTAGDKPSSRKRARGDRGRTQMMGGAGCAPCGRQSNEHRRVRSDLLLGGAWDRFAVPIRQDHVVFENDIPAFDDFTRKVSPRSFNLNRGGKANWPLPTTELETKEEAIVIPTETGNHAIKDGSLQKSLEAIMGKLKPEAAYFFPEHGLRSAMMIFDMKDASEIPAIAEPLFAGLNARIQLQPVMNADDLKKGLDIARQAM